QGNDLKSNCVDRMVEFPASHTEPYIAQLAHSSETERSKSLRARLFECAGTDRRHDLNNFSPSHALRPRSATPQPMDPRSDTSPVVDESAVLNWERAQVRRATTV